MRSWPKHVASPLIPSTAEIPLCLLRALSLIDPSHVERFGDKTTSAPTAYDPSFRLLQLWSAPPHGERRSRSCLHLSLPCLPAQNWKRVRRSGAIPQARRSSQRRILSVRPRRRRGEQNHIPLLPEMRRHGALCDRRRTRCRPSWSVRRTLLSSAVVLGI